MQTKVKDMTIEEATGCINEYMEDNKWKSGTLTVAGEVYDDILEIDTGNITSMIFLSSIGMPLHVISRNEEGNIIMNNHYKTIRGMMKGLQRIHDAAERVTEEC